jgi:hypothetical protein
VNNMTRIALAMAAAAVVMTTGSVGGAVAAKAENLRMAQGVEVEVGRDRDTHEDRVHRERRDPDVTVGVGPGGVVVGPKERCHTRSVTVERDDGTSVTRQERHCD